MIPMTGRSTASLICVMSRTVFARIPTAPATDYTGYLVDVYRQIEGGEWVQVQTELKATEWTDTDAWDVLGTATL